MNQVKVLDRPKENETGPFSSTKLRARRTLKIEDLSDPDGGKLFAGIRLKGRWLVRAGFRPGDRVAVVVVSPGIMQLRVVEEHGESNSSPDLEVVYDGTISLFQPLTDRAREWLDSHCPPGDDHQYLGDALAVEARYVEDILLHARKDGLVM